MILGPGFDSPELPDPVLGRLAALGREARADLRAVRPPAGGAAEAAAGDAALRAVTPALVLWGLARLDGEERDRFVVSAAGAGPGVYAALGRLGLFPPGLWRALHGRAGSPFEEAPTRDVPGIDWTASGPAGSALAAAAGFALAARRRGDGGRAFLLAGAGELGTGLAAEARRLARERGLANLSVVLLSPAPADGLLDDFCRDGWYVARADGADPRSLHSALRAGLSSGLPSLVAGCVDPSPAGDAGEEAEAAAVPADEDGGAGAAFPVPDDGVAALAARLPQRPAGVVVPRAAGEPISYSLDAAVSPAEAFAAALAGFSSGAGDPPAAAVLSGAGTAELAMRLLPRGPDAVVPCASPDLAAALASGLSLGGVAVWWIASEPAVALAPGLHLLDANGAAVRVAASPTGGTRGADSGGLFGLVASLPGGKLLAPADACQADRIVRWVGVHGGTFVVLLPRHPFPAARREDGSAAFDGAYVFDPRRADHLRRGEEIVLACAGSSLPEALAAWDLLASEGTRVDLFSLPSLTDVGEGALVEMARCREARRGRRGGGPHRARRLAPGSLQRPRPPRPRPPPRRDGLDRRRGRDERLARLGARPHVGGARRQAGDREAGDAGPPPRPGHPEHLTAARSKGVGDERQLTGRGDDRHLRRRRRPREEEARPRPLRPSPVRPPLAPDRHRRQRADRRGRRELAGGDEGGRLRVRRTTRRSTRPRRESFATRLVLPPRRPEGPARPRGDEGAARGAGDGAGPPGQPALLPGHAAVGLRAHRGATSARRASAPSRRRSRGAASSSRSRSATTSSSARALNEEIHGVFRERQIFRIDHYLGKETVQNILVFRFAQRASSSRSGTGATSTTCRSPWPRRSASRARRATTSRPASLRDMVQNHMLQLLASWPWSRPSRFEPTRSATRR